MVVVALLLWLYPATAVVAEAVVARVRVEVVVEVVVIMVRVRSVVAAGWLGLGLEVVMQEDDAMAEEDAFLVDNFEGGLCVDYTDVRIDGRCHSGSNKEKGKVGE
ncbi:hypothetical protein Tco_0088438 [Tanacetum coccineum]